jgi:hypothetical protein
MSRQQPGKLGSGVSADAHDCGAQFLLHRVVLVKGNYSAPRCSSKVLK